MYACFRAFAIMQTPGGAVRGRTASVEWDGALMIDKIRLASKSSIQMAVEKKWKSVAGKTDDQIKAMIEDKFEKDWLAEREFGKRKAETKAARNAIKSLVAITDSYRIEDLRDKEFVVIKFVFCPDTSDPEVKRMVIEAGLRAQRALFGVTAATAAGGSYLPEGSHVAVAALPAASAGDPPPEPADSGPGTVDAEVEDYPEPEVIEDEWTACERDRAELFAGLEAMKKAGKIPPDKITNALGEAIGNKDAATFRKVYGWWQKYKV
jgi:hypothetical protein